VSVDYRTHEKYGKRLRYQFDTVWRAAHAWDRFVANPLLPALNVGFDTLTVYPNTDGLSCDGMVGRQTTSETWATIRAGAGTEISVTGAQSSAFSMQASATLNEFQNLRRSILLFNTGAIGPASAVKTAPSISAAVLSLAGFAKVDGLVATPTADIYTSTPIIDTSLLASDFGQMGVTSQTGAPVTYANLLTSGYTDFTLSATGRGNININGVSRFACRNANYDVANVQPAWVSTLSSSWSVNFADQTGFATDPKLVVTYTPAIYSQGDQDALVSTYLQGIFSASLPNAPIDLTTLLTRRLSTLTGDMTARLKSIIVSAGSKN
jgi:hypothetical protein